MSVRRRAWENRDGSQGEAWIVIYTDAGGKRRLKTFERKKDAERFETAVGSELSHGLHVPDAESITIAESTASSGRRSPPIARGPCSTFAHRRCRQLAELLGADPTLAADLVRDRVAVIFAAGAPSAAIGDP